MLVIFIQKVVSLKEICVFLKIKKILVFLLLNEENEYGSFPLFENSKKKSMKLVHLTAFSRFGRRIASIN